MKINIESLIVGARRAKGLTVIIDVLRAFTVAAYVMNNGAKKIIPVEKTEEAFKLKKENPGYILVGEKDSYKIKGFDYGNSPTEIKDVDFSGKTIVLRSSGGTKGILNAKKATEIILGAFVNIKSIVDYIKKNNPSILTLVPIGGWGTEIREEDELCAEYIKNSLEGKESNFNEMKEKIKNTESAGKFFGNERPDLLESDFDYSMDIDRFNFVLKVMKVGNTIEILKEEVG